MTRSSTPTSSRSSRWVPDLILVDGRHLLYRTTDVHRDLEAEVDGETVPTGGVYGSLTVLAKLRKRYGASMIIAWEGTGNFRNKLYPEYKARSAPTVDEIAFREGLAAQEKLLRDILSKLGVSQYEARGGEADDVLATLAAKASAFGNIDVGVYTGDGDLHQIVDRQVRVISPLRGGKEKVWDEAAVKEKWGVDPSDLATLKALSGDSSDNIPGLPGIGLKTAAAFINRYGSLVAILDAAGQGNPRAKAEHRVWDFTEKQRQKVVDGAEKAKLYLRLTTVDPDIKMKPQKADKDIMEARRLMARLKFRRLLEHAQFHELKRLPL